ncbi:hypothetical protein [Halotalea alkalilenta]|uniref:hypothetical protein n=1 Tax=Halotalea alkalilenta TaxID=376489 RepID=UPI00048420A5|nr:hypothetical protein [Halotalea alkalilenta]
MEILSGVETFSHILNIKEKLFPREKAIVSAIGSFPKNQESESQNYCSVFIEHSYDPKALGSSEREKIEIVFAKKSEFTIPIRHIDWVFMERKLDTIKPINLELSKLLLVDKEGLLLELGIKEILRAQIEHMELKGRKLEKSLKTMGLQITYADSYRVFVQAPPSLKESIYQLYSSD